MSDQPHVDGARYAQTDILHGTFTWGYQYTISGVHLHEWSGHFGSIDVLSDPQFQIQPHDALQPFQLSFQTNLLSYTWPHIGPVVVQSALAGGWQWTPGEGAAAVVSPSLDISTTYVEWLHIQGGVQFTVQEGADHGLHTSVSVPATVISGVFHF
jgi:hypothetical protein